MEETHEEVEIQHDPSSSLVDVTYESKEMQRLISLTQPEHTIPVGLNDVFYKAEKVFPDWVLSSQVWKSSKASGDIANEISEILKIPMSKRSPEQTSSAIHWLMSVWKVAQTMGYKKCAAMLKEFKYLSVEPGEKIVNEGERGVTFYIVVSGLASVYKEGIGMVGQLGKGKCFGEVALLQGKDIRTATIIATTKVELLSLLKSDFQYFVRDIQDQERRENFHVLTSCKLFKSWNRSKIDKILNSCKTKIYEDGQSIFRQGDPPDDLYVIVEGAVNIVKEVVFICRNRWPVAFDQWAERSKKVSKPINLKTLGRGDFFGEVSIIKNLLRSTSAIAITHTIVIALDKLEFLHLINVGSSNTDSSQVKNAADIAVTYLNDKDLLHTVDHIPAGPSSVAMVGNIMIKRPPSSSQNRLTSRNSHPNLLANSPRNRPKTPLLPSVLSSGPPDESHDGPLRQAFSFATPRPEESTTNHPHHPAPNPGALHPLHDHYFQSVKAEHSHTSTHHVHYESSQGGGTTIPSPHTPKHSANADHHYWDDSFIKDSDDDLDLEESHHNHQTIHKTKSKSSSHYPKVIKSGAVMTTFGVEEMRKQNKVKALSSGAKQKKVNVNRRSPSPPSPYRLQPRASSHSDLNHPQDGADTFNDRPSSGWNSIGNMGESTPLENNEKKSMKKNEGSPLIDPSTKPPNRNSFTKKKIGFGSHTSPTQTTQKTSLNHPSMEQQSNGMLPKVIMRFNTLYHHHRPYLPFPFRQNSVMSVQNSFTPKLPSPPIPFNPSPSGNHVDQAFLNPDNVEALKVLMQLNKEYVADTIATKSRPLSPEGLVMKPSSASISSTPLASNHHRPLPISSHPTTKITSTTTTHTTTATNSSGTTTPFRNHKPFQSMNDQLVSHKNETQTITIRPEYQIKSHPPTSTSSTSSSSHAIDHPMTSTTHTSSFLPTVDEAVLQLETEPEHSSGLDDQNTSNIVYSISHGNPPSNHVNPSDESNRIGSPLLYHNFRRPFTASDIIKPPSPIPSPGKQFAFPDNIMSRSRSSDGNLRPSTDYLWSIDTLRHTLSTSSSLTVHIDPYNPGYPSHNPSSYNNFHENSLFGTTINTPSIRLKTLSPSRMKRTPSSAKHDLKTPTGIMVSSRPSSAIKMEPLRLLNKARLSYRDAMEG